MTEVTRGEFDLLKQIVASNQARLEGMDQAGTKGVLVVQTQLTDLAKDVVRLESEMDKRFDEHLRTHAEDQQARVAGRRWLTGTVIAVLVLLLGIIGLIINAHPLG